MIFSASLAIAVTAISDEHITQLLTAVISVLNDASVTVFPWKPHCNLTSLNLC